MGQETQAQTPHHSKTLLIPAILAGGLLVGGLIGYFIGAVQGYKAGYQAYGIEIEKNQQSNQESQMTPTPLPTSAPEPYTTLETKGAWTLRVQPKPEIPGAIFEELSLYNIKTKEQKIIGYTSVYGAAGKAGFTNDSNNVILLNSFKDNYERDPKNRPAILVYSISNEKFIKQVSMADIRNSDPTISIATGDLGYLAISPDGNKVAFSSVHNALSPSLYDDILVYNIATDKTIKLPETGHPKSWIDNATVQYETVDTSNKEPGFPKPITKQIKVE